MIVTRLSYSDGYKTLKNKFVMARNEATATHANQMCKILL